jgi:hypothetical protein
MTRLISQIPEVYEGAHSCLYEELNALEIGETWEVPAARIKTSRDAYYIAAYYNEKWDGNKNTAKIRACNTSRGFMFVRVD